MQKPLRPSRASIWRLSTCTCACTAGRLPKPTCRNIFASARLRFTRWCSRSNAQDSSDASRASLAASKCSLIRTACQSYFDPGFNLSKSLCSGTSRCSGCGVSIAHGRLRPDELGYSDYCLSGVHISPCRKSADPNDQRGAGDHSSDHRDGFRQRQQEDRSECIVRMRPDKVDEPRKIGCHRSVLTRPTSVPFCVSTHGKPKRCNRRNWFTSAVSFRPKWSEGNGHPDGFRFLACCLLWRLGSVVPVQGNLPS